MLTLSQEQLLQIQYSYCIQIVDDASSWKVLQKFLMFWSSQVNLY